MTSSTTKTAQERCIRCIRMKGGGEDSAVIDFVNLVFFRLKNFGISGTFRENGQHL